MTNGKMRIPLTALERCGEAFKLALDLYDTVMRDKVVVDNLERFDVARMLSIASNHFLEGRLALQEALRRAAKAEREDV